MKILDLTLTPYFFEEINSHQNSLNSDTYPLKMHFPKYTHEITQIMDYANVIIEKCFGFLCENSEFSFDGICVFDLTNKPYRINFKAICDRVLNGVKNSEEQMVSQKVKQATHQIFDIIFNKKFHEFADVNPLSSGFRFYQTYIYLDPQLNEKGVVKLINLFKRQITLFVHSTLQIPNKNYVEYTADNYEYFDSSENLYFHARAPLTPPGQLNAFNYALLNVNEKSAAELIRNNIDLNSKGQNILMYLYAWNYENVPTPFRGDLVCYFRSDFERVSHMGIYLGKINGKHLVESKWPNTASYVYTHELSAIPSSLGQNLLFMRKKTSLLNKN